MKNPILLIAFMAFILFGSGYLLINTFPPIKKIAIEIGVIPAPPVIPVPPSYNAIFIIGDGTGSGYSSYSVPRISTDFVANAIDSISSRGTGDIWLTFVDKQGFNNKVLHFEIQRATGLSKRRERQSGERKGIYDKWLVQFVADSIKGAKLASTFQKTFEEKKRQFLICCQEIIKTGYAPRNNGEDFSDCIGSLNAGLRILETVKHDSIHFRSILFVSDGVQDIPENSVSQKLSPISEDIMVVTVNNSGSKNNILQGHTIEVDNLDRGLEKAIQLYNPN